MKDPQNFVCPLISAAAFLLSASIGFVAHGQSFYQQAQAAVGATDAAAWQPPQPRSARDRTVIRQVTNMVPLKPPSDIFAPKIRPLDKPSVAPPVASTAWNQIDSGTHLTSSKVESPSHPKRFSSTGQFAGARKLGNSPNSHSPGNGLFDPINAIAESDQPKFVSANLELDAASGRSNFEALTSDATAKLGKVKEWVGEKTGAILGGMQDGSWQERFSRMFGGADIGRIVGGLAVVIGGYLGLVWLLQVINPAGSGALPREALEVVGSAPLNSKQNLQLIRLGSKLMLMIHGPDGVQPVGEVNDPAEVEHLLAVCGGGRGQRVSPAVNAAIENRLRATQPTVAPAVEVAQQQSDSISLSPSDSNNLNQLLRALEKYHPRGHVYEA